ncbi:hypothetical protein ABVK25_010850 [Lepraria finkii]|uniref:Uncharacterized protein n=1 Tax=Lepraria finkii TaxID=1340010 RepID=A0ABR4AT75_9LECA
MRASIAIAAVLGADALAQPHLRNIHRHQKRDEVKEWNQNGVHYVEDIVDPYVTVGGGHAAPEASAAPSPIGQEKYVQNHQTQPQQEQQQQQPTHFATPSPQQYVPQQQPSATAAAPAPAPSNNTQSSNPPSDGSYWASSPLSPPNTPRRPGGPLPRQLLAHQMELPTRRLHLVLQPRQELLHHHNNSHNLHH